MLQRSKLIMDRLIVVIPVASHKRGSILPERGESIDHSEDALSCLSPDMAEKEIWVYLLAYNLIRLIMIESALLCDIIPRQLSFKHTMQLWLTYHQQMDVGTNIELIKELLFLVGQLRVGNRTHRVEPRVIKRRPKAYSMMVKPRTILRQEIVQSWT